VKRFWSTLIGGNHRNRHKSDAKRLAKGTLVQADAIITTHEVTDMHGTGVIINRIFGGSPNILSIRTADMYPEHSLGETNLVLGNSGLSRRESYARMLEALDGMAVRRILCVPYHPDELVWSIVLKEMFGAPLCIFVMDDSNIYSDRIPDELLADALAKADLRLAISPEMRNAYEQKYRRKFYVVPPVVRDGVARTTPLDLPAGSAPLTGALIGSLWSPKWLQMLRETVKQAGVQLDWYGNSKASWLATTEEDLRQDGIHVRGFTPEAELTEKLKQYSYALIPSGTLDERDDRQEIARLSLPTRLPYLLAAANMPMIVLGNPATAAASFVDRFQVGLISPYDGASLRKAVDQVCQPAQQRDIRARAANRASLFSAKGLADWIWQSLDKREAVDDRFETAFRRRKGEMIVYVDPPVPKDVIPDFAPDYQALRRMKENAFSPDFIVDIGSSTGVWSHAASRVFPSARFILLDPLHEHYKKKNNWFFTQHPEFECIGVAISDHPGEAEFDVSDDLYGSSLFAPADSRAYDRIKVPIRTLDDLAREKKLSGRGLLKIDVQFAEHLVLAGARELLPQVDAILVELSLFRYAPQAKLYHEMCDLIRQLGFRYFEDVGGWRCPIRGIQLQKDVLFVRENLVPD
jgi:FkbM family methyltransferase